MSSRPSGGPGSDENGGVGTTSAVAAPDATARRAVTIFTGLLVGATVLTATATLGTSPATLVGTTLGAVAIGITVGWLVSSRVPALSSRLVRTVHRRPMRMLLLGAVLVILPVGSALGAALLGSVDGALERFVLLASMLVVVAGYALVRLVQTRYADAMVIDEPIAIVRWQPSRESLFSLFLVCIPFWILFAGSQAVAGNWTDALLWIVLSMLVLGFGFAEGQFRLGTPGSTPTIRIHEAGIVQQRPYTRSFVSWADIDHVRLDSDEFIVDYGSSLERFDRDELDGLEDALRTIDERLANEVQVI